MRKIGLLYRSLILLTFISVFTLGMLMYSPNDVAAYPEYSTDGSCIECHPAGFEGETGDTGTTEDTEDAGPPDELAGASASLEPLDHYEPLPVEPIHQEANNTLLASGLGIAALLIGGSIVMDRRKK